MMSNDASVDLIYIVIVEVDRYPGSQMLINTKSCSALSQQCKYMGGSVVMEDIIQTGTLQ